MQGRMYLPDGRGRSPTAIPDKADLRDDNVFSAVVLAHGGAGEQSLFANPRGQTIPALAGSGIAATQSHQKTYSQVTTNLSQAGVLGNAIGDASIRGIGITLERCGILPATGVLNLYGATQYEVVDVHAKVYFQLKIASKVQTQGPVWAFPEAGGAVGTVSTTATSTSFGNLSNGWTGMMKRLKLPILVGRTDNIEGLVGVASSASLAFSVTTGAGQASLLTVLLSALIKGDVR